MTVKELSKECSFEELCVPYHDREVHGAYIGDLLSWVMGRANADNAWITIMSNINVIAVASLSDVACVILAEDVKLEDDVLKTAEVKGINVLKSAYSAYEVALMLNGKV